MAKRVLYDHPGTKKKSQVWKYFGFKKINESLPPTKSNLNMEFACCKICFKEYKNTGNTTNFLVHINSEHKPHSSSSTDQVHVGNTEQHQTPSGPSLSQRTLDFNNNACVSRLGPEKKKKIDETLYKLVIGKMLPPSIVDNDYFIGFVKALDPRYPVMTRKTLMGRLDIIKSEMEQKIKGELKDVDGLGITHDGWTSSATESYNTTTVHYIKEWELKSAVLNTVKMEGSHTSEKIAASLLETKAKWALPEHIVATTDNAANEKKAFELIKWPRFGCYGHRINLVKNSLNIPEMARILAKSRKLVTLFHTSTSVNDKLMEKQKLLLPESSQGHRLIADVTTRWNSTLQMLQRILEQLPALMAVATDDTVSNQARTTLKNNLLTFEESSLAEKVVDVLEPFKIGTEIICSETNPTINKVLPLVKKLLGKLNEDETDPNPIKQLKKTMTNQLLNRSEVEDIALLGALLNPYTKGFEHWPMEKDRAIQLLETEAAKIDLNSYIKQEKEETENSVSAPQLPQAPEGLEQITNIDNPKIIESDCDEIHVPAKKLKSMDTEDFLSDVMCVGESKVSNNDMLKEEISRYINVEMEGNFTVLQWWKQNELYFPRLSRVARRFLCVQASSVPSERVFSVAGSLVSKKRSRLTPENVDKFIFLNKNMKGFW